MTPEQPEMYATEAHRAYGIDRLANVVNLARQEKKSSGMTGRQWKKHRKNLRRSGITTGGRTKSGNTAYEL